MNLQVSFCFFLPILLRLIWATHFVRLLTRYRKEEEICNIYRLACSLDLKIERWHFYFNESIILLKSPKDFLPIVFPWVPFGILKKSAIFAHFFFWMTSVRPPKLWTAWYKAGKSISTPPTKGWLDGLMVTFWVSRYFVIAAISLEFWPHLESMCEWNILHIVLTITQFQHTYSLVCVCTGYRL